MSETEILGSILSGGKAEETLIVSSVERTGTLRRGAIIAHDTLNETILLQVTNKITWADVSEQDLYLMSENESLAYKIIQRSPKSYVLRCVPVGVIRDEGDGPQIFSEPISFMADRTPEVRSLNPKERKLIYERGDLLVGRTVDGFQVAFPINDLLQRHLSVIGMTGCGKSYFLGLLCEELAKHKAAILIIDPHNEYLPMAQTMPKEVNRMLYSVGSAVGLNTYTLDVKKISAYDFQHFTGMREGSTSMLQNTIQNLRRTKPEYTIFDILNRLDFITQNGQASEATAAMWARNYLRNLANTGFIGTSEPPIKEMTGANQISVVAMSGVKERIQQFVATSILQRIFQARKEDRIPPLILIIEEAHRFAPSAEKVSSSAIMRTLAAEGRKFGICLVVVSQRPSRLDSTVLSQCVTNIVMKVKNPMDLTRIRESAENVTEEVVRKLPRFEKGEALIMGEAFPISIRFKVRSDRKTEHGGRNVDFEKTWLEDAAKKDIKRFEFPDEL
ncbi:ATP-binding protein [Candidatus Bathyarchaeota archaeon]|nr:ATP-binding protein [Candidatus Bathyarchaeota archaeon]MCK4434051.1 ATP-binding protein [Candidatus Bathyarchaeota archaeon]